MTVAPPKFAATVILMRDGPDDRLEVFLVRRHPKSRFLAGAHVFPGGKVDDADGAPALLERLALPAGSLPEGPSGPSLRVAAIRETWEECAVLLVHGDLPLDLLEGPAELNRVLEVPDLRLAGDRLEYVGRWVTPEMEPRRYDTAFYLAVQPQSQRAVHTDVETTSGGWFSPGHAIDAMHRGEVFLAPPTLRNLEVLAERATADEAMQRARSAPKPLVQPEMRMYEGRLEIILPGDSAYEGQSLGPRVPGPTKMALVDGRWVYD